MERGGRSAKSFCRRYFGSAQPLSAGPSAPAKCLTALSPLESKYASPGGEHLHVVSVHKYLSDTTVSCDGPPLTISILNLLVLRLGSNVLLSSDQYCPDVHDGDDDSCPEV